MYLPTASSGLIDGFRAAKNFYRQRGRNRKIRLCVCFATARYKGQCGKLEIGGNGSGDGQPINALKAGNYGKFLEKVAKPPSGSAFVF